MDYRIEINGVLYPCESHYSIHQMAKTLCAQLGAEEYYIVSVIIEGVSNPYPYIQGEEFETKRQYINRI